MTHKFKEGGIWDEPELKIKTNFKLTEHNNRCRHVENGVLRAVVLVSNNGGYDSTGACLDCILEASKTISKERICTVNELKIDESLITTEEELKKNITDFNKLSENERKEADSYFNG